MVSWGPSVFNGISSESWFSCSFYLYTIPISILQSPGLLLPFVLKLVSSLVSRVLVCVVTHHTFSASASIQVSMWHTLSSPNSTICSEFLAQKWTQIPTQGDPMDVYKGPENYRFSNWIHVSLKLFSAIFFNSSIRNSKINTDNTDNSAENGGETKQIKETHMYMCVRVCSHTRTDSIISKITPSLVSHLLRPMKCIFV